jgi:opacity protein-like surface antigen
MSQAPAIHGPVRVLAAAVLLLTLAPIARAADDIEAQVKRNRNAAGIRVGLWEPRGLQPMGGGSSSEGLAFEGYFQKGLDLHLAWENTLGFWRRDQSSTEPGTLGGETRRELQSYVIPTMTAIKFFPVTRPEAPFEPFLSAGLGVVLGIDRETATSTDPLDPNGETTAFQTGFGFRAGVGFEWHISEVFGLGASGRYQWLGFGEDLGGAKTFEGLGGDLGLTYRFQYR